MDTPSLKMFKVRGSEQPGLVGDVPAMVGGWDQIIFEVLSKPVHSVILC